MPRNQPVIAPCLTCQGRCVAHDEVFLDDGTRRLHRTVCPSCQGKGVLDYANGPVTKNLGDYLFLFH